MEELNDQIAQRLKKLEQLRSLGIDPFGGKFDVQDRAGDLVARYGAATKEELERKSVTTTLAGRVTALRWFGKAAFASLQDGVDAIQVYLKKDVLGDQGFALAELLDIGDWIGVSGPLFRTKTNELTVEVKQLTLLCKSLRPLPEKWHGLTDVEIRYRQRYTDLIVNDEVRLVFRQRAAIIRAVRAFLDARQFLEVETPVLQPLYGGASARPFVTRHNTLDMDLYLRIADELYLKRLIVGGLERVYEISKDFRNDGMDRTHSPEFTMLEFYQAFADYEETLRTTQALFLHVVATVRGGEPIVWEGKPIDFTLPWRRLTIAEAAREGLGIPELPRDEKGLREAAGRAGVSLDPAFGYGRILDEIVSVKVQPGLWNPTFLVDFPRESSPLAKVKRGNPDLVERFELIIAGMETADSFSEQNDPEEQGRAFE